MGGWSGGGGPFFWGGGVAAPFGGGPWYIAILVSYELPSHILVYCYTHTNIYWSLEFSYELNCHLIFWCIAILIRSWNTYRCRSFLECECLTYSCTCLNPTPCTLHPTPYTLHPTPYTLHPTPFWDMKVSRTAAFAFCVCGSGSCAT